MAVTQKTLRLARARQLSKSEFDASKRCRVSILEKHLGHEDLIRFVYGFVSLPSCTQPSHGTISVSIIAPTLDSHTHCDTEESGRNVDSTVGICCFGAQVSPLHNPIYTDIAKHAAHNVQRLFPSTKQHRHELCMHIPTCRCVYCLQSRICSPSPAPRRAMTSPARARLEPAPCVFLRSAKRYDDEQEKEEQDTEDESARKQAMKNLVSSWQERLQLISVIVSPCVALFGVV